MVKKTLLVTFIVTGSGIVLENLFNFFDATILPDRVDLLFLIGMLFSGAMLLLRTSNFLKNWKPYSVVFGTLSVLVLGGLLKILHLPGANIFLILGGASTPIAYMVIVASRESKDWTDGLKVFWLFLFIYGRLFIIMHWPMGWEISAFADFVFVLLVPVVVFTTADHEQLMEEYER